VLTGFPAKKIRETRGAGGQGIEPNLGKPEKPEVFGAKGVGPSFPVKKEGETSKGNPMGKKKESTFGGVVRQGKEN